VLISVSSVVSDTGSTQLSCYVECLGRQSRITSLQLRNSIRSQPDVLSLPAPDIDVQQRWTTTRTRWLRGITVVTAVELAWTNSSTASFECVVCRFTENRLLSCPWNVSTDMWKLLSFSIILWINVWSIDIYAAKILEFVYFASPDGWNRNTFMFKV